jgi:hypothetical protein
VPPGATALRVSPPAGETVPLDPARPRILLDQVGVWQVDYDGPAEVTAGGRALVAVNAPVGEGDLMRARPEAAAAGPAGAGSGVVQGFRSVAPWLIALTLAVLLVEWLLAHAHVPAALRRRRAVPTRPPGGPREPRPAPVPVVPPPPAERKV